MKHVILVLLLGLVVSSLFVLRSWGDHHEHAKTSEIKVKRVGMVVGIHAEKIPE